MSLRLIPNKYYLAAPNLIVRINEITCSGVNVQTFSPTGEELEEATLTPASFIRRVYKLKAGCTYLTQGRGKGEEQLVHIQKNPITTDKDFPMKSAGEGGQTYTIFGFFYLDCSSSNYNIVAKVKN